MSYQTANVYNLSLNPQKQNGVSMIPIVSEEQDSKAALAGFIVGLISSVIALGLISGGILALLLWNQTGSILYDPSYEVHMTLSIVAAIAGLVGLPVSAAGLSLSFDGRYSASRASMAIGGIAFSMFGFVVSLFFIFFLAWFITHHL